jgi:hypothetical protein
MTLSIKGLLATVSINDTHITTLCRYAEYRYAECPYAEWRYDECRYAECLGAEINASIC